VRVFSLNAIVRYRDGRYGVSRTPHSVGAVEAWWLPTKQCGWGLRRATLNGISIEQAAAEMHVPCSPHHVVIQRATRSVERIDNAVDDARLRGDMRFFTREYRRRRLAAKAAGNGFMSFAQAEARL